MSVLAVVCGVAYLFVGSVIAGALKVDFPEALAWVFGWPLTLVVVAGFWLGELITEEDFWP